MGKREEDTPARASYLIPKPVDPYLTCGANNIASPVFHLAVHFMTVEWVREKH